MMGTYAYIWLDDMKFIAYSVYVEPEIVGKESERHKTEIQMTINSGSIPLC